MESDQEFPPRLRVGPTVPPLPERLTPAAAAEYLGVSEQTLRNWRSQGRGPAYWRLGRIFYVRTDLDRWARTRRVEPR